MSFESISRLRWGLRTRLLVYTSGVIALTLAAAFLWSVYNVRNVLRDRNDAFLRHELSEFLGASAEISKSDDQTENPLDEFLHEAKSSEDAGLYVLLRHDGARHVFPAAGQAETFANAVGELPVGVEPRTLDIPEFPEGMRVIGAVLPVRVGRALDRRAGNAAAGNRKDGHHVHRPPRSGSERRFSLWPSWAGCS